MTHLELCLNLPVYEDVIFSLSYICFHCTEIKEHSLYHVSSLRRIETCTVVFLKALNYECKVMCVCAGVCEIRYYCCC